MPTLDEMPPILPSGTEMPMPVDSFIKMYTSSSQYYSVLLGDNGDPAFAGKIKNGIKVKLMEQVEASGKEALELDYSLEYMLSAMIGILTYWFKSKENIAKDDLLRLIYGLMSNDM